MLSDLKAELPDTAAALPGREQPITVTEPHVVNGRSLQAGWPENFEEAIFGLGCFWGAERRFWQQPGVWITAVGYAGGITPNPTYEEVCSGKTGHTEVVRVVFDPEIISYEQLLTAFWESHDPTQGMRQGNDRGTQYRSAIYTFGDTQAVLAKQSFEHYQQRLQAAGKPKITTEICVAPPFYFAETYHQQYLARNPDGYCGLGGTGVCYLG